MEKGVEPDTAVASDRLERIEERAWVETVSRVSGRVDVSTVSESFEEIITQVLTSSQAEVFRHDRDELMPDGAPLPVTRTENGVLIVPVFEERLVIEKRLYLVEEMHIRMIDKQDTVSIPVTLRKQRVVISRTDPETGEVLPNEPTA